MQELEFGACLQLAERGRGTRAGAEGASPRLPTLASFLPKFENDDDSMQSVHALLREHRTAGVLLTLKHSGSLYLVAGLHGKLATFTKNSTALGTS